MDFSAVLEFLKRQLDQPSGVVAENACLCGKYGSGPSSGDVEQQQRVEIISSWPLRQVKHPDSRARFIFFFAIDVPLHRRAICGTEFILGVKKTILQYTARDHS
jgi:hypothetical protein